MKKTILAVGLILSLSLGSFAQQKAELKVKKGDTFLMITDMSQEISQTVMGQKMAINMEIAMQLDLEVQDMSKETITFSQAYKSMKMNMNSPMQGMEISLDSSEPENEMNKPIKSLIGKKILVIVNYKGEVQEVKGLDEIMGEMSGLAASGADFGQFLDAEAMEKTYQSLFPVEYGKSYKQGEKWEVDSSVDAEISILSKTSFTATEVSKKNLTFDLTTTMKMEGMQEANGMEMDMDMSGDLTGNGSVDLETGLMSSYNLSGTIEGLMTMKANEQLPMDMEVPMSIKQSSTTTVK
ncbi:MAG: DUF6263 family protein [Flavobacteriales bacterium]